MKPGCENMAFFNVFSFFSKAKKAGRNLTDSDFFKIFGFISNIKKKSDEICFFSGYFSEQ